MRPAATLQDRIALDPAIREGKPTIRGTRLPVTAVTGSLTGGIDFEEVAQEVDIVDNHIDSRPNEYVLMRLYHLLSAAFAIEDIEKRRLKISRFADLNDPFELSAVELSKSVHRLPMKTFKGKMHDRFGLLCFTTYWRSPVMWSHYADKHRGICLGFDVPDEVATRITYDAKRLPFEVIEAAGRHHIKPHMVQKLLTTKFREWSYEREVRIYLPLEREDKDGNHYYQRFDKNVVLREVVLGPLCEVRIDEARTLVAEFNPGVIVRKARLAFKTFRVVPDLRVESRSTK